MSCSHECKLIGKRICWGNSCPVRLENFVRDEADAGAGISFLAQVEKASSVTRNVGVILAAGRARQPRTLRAGAGLRDEVAQQIRFPIRFTLV